MAARSKNKMMKRILTAAVFAAALLYASGGYAWDGDWTSAHSMKDVYDDPKSSHRKAGTDPPQKFYTSTPRDYVDEDPEELNDYFHRYRKDYAPYALARVIYNLKYNGRAIPKGYYLVKAGQWGDGSPDVSLKKTSAGQNNISHGEGVNPPDADPDIQAQIMPSGGNTAAVASRVAEPAGSHTDIIPGPAAQGESNSAAALGTAQTGGAKKGKQPQEKGYQFFLFKRMGRVIAVVPIHRVEAYRPPRKEHIPRHALAWVEMENRRPVFKFYFKHHIYTTEFQ